MLSNVKPTTESLGSRVVEGVSADGTRTTTVWPLGSVGNDRELVATDEVWYSRQLQMNVLSKGSDPRYGDTTTQLSNVSLAEPDPSLFIPPADHGSRDRRALKTATWTKSRHCVEATLVFDS